MWKKTIWEKDESRESPPMLMTAMRKAKVVLNAARVCFLHFFPLSNIKRDTNANRNFFDVHMINHNR